MRVFSYWEGNKPEYIKICIETMKRFCKEFTLITPDNVGALLYGSGLNHEYKNLNKPAHRADCIRVAAVNHLGGLWIDCDTVFIRDISSFEDTVCGKKFAYTRWNDGRCINGCFYGEKGNSVTEEWLSVINKSIRPGPDWTALGEKILTPIMNSKRHDSVSFQFDRRIFIPLNMDKIPWAYFEPIHWSSFITEETVAFTLNNSWYCDFKKDFVESRQPWVGDALVNTLLRDAR